MPDDWKDANVAPVFKKGNQSTPANYRPVSLTSISCKLMEHIMVSNIMSHLEQHQVLAEVQHRFRSKRSCKTQLMVTTHDILQALDSGKQVDATILDFSKAFNVVPHHRLMCKLEHYGIHGQARKWIHAFLNSRRQRVVVNGESSEYADVTSGVPQGTVLSPILFLVFNNNICANITSSI